MTSTKAFWKLRSLLNVMSCEVLSPGDRMGSTELEDHVMLGGGGGAGVAGGGDVPPPPPHDKSVAQDARTSKRVPKNTVADTPEADAMVLRFERRVIV